MKYNFSHPSLMKKLTPSYRTHKMVIFASHDSNMSTYNNDIIVFLTIFIITSMTFIVRLHRYKPCTVMLRSFIGEKNMLMTNQACTL